ncbi:unnamed protein product [Orchesella dallaii]|uniref:F-box domain-containing protein n=1 Tax=Orchesella dallaii TaxID=48710 RepID=A0ABP1QZJ6_9HEXA
METGQLSSMNLALKGEKEQLPFLPVEVWEEIFQCLNHDDRINIGLSSNYFGAIIDGMTTPPINWIHHYPDKHYTEYKTFVEAMITFRKTPGTRFIRVVDIEKFQHEIDQRPLVDGGFHPFKNSTLIIDWTCVQDFSALLNALPGFLEQHGHHVKKLLYFLHHLVPQCIMNLRQILKSLPNVQSITFFSSTWSNIFPQDNFFAEFSDMTSLSELAVLGKNNFKFMEAFATRFGHQIRCLHWSQREDFNRTPKSVAQGVSKKIMNKFGNLKSFKIADCSFALFPVTSAINVPVKQFAIRVTPFELKANYTCIFEGLRILLAFINAFKSTLEILSLHLDPSCFQPPLQPYEIEDLCSAQQYLGVQELSFLYAAVDYPIFTVLLRSCPNLKCIILQDQKHTLKNINIEVDKYEMVELSRRLWNLVRGTKVYKILIRTGRFNQKANKILPYVFEVKEEVLE